MSKIESAQGHAVAVHGDDIDTDRIIPARFLKTITFDGLEDHVFEDDRLEAQAHGKVHPFDDPAHKGAAILLGGANFGCGSSREHAPQAIKRWGIGAVVAVSFAEIFFGNSLMIGLACATVSPEQMADLMALADANPTLDFRLDIAASTLTAGDRVIPVTMPESVRSALLSGGWDATSLLLDKYEEVEQLAARLPYVSGWDRLSA
ncbi:MAG: 3-isopropylmalate dehydratase small subunit [Acidobacteria bacterium SCN 69-37]|nr:MAG: 3-isopropylmalate dehydratase small subunit [Acidobacteria bacterium SCN 69-37]